MDDGPGISLVPLDRRHLACTLEWANDPELMRLMNRHRIVSEAEHESWFASIGSRQDRAYFAIEEGEQHRHVGNAWLWAIDPHHRKAELRIVVGTRSARGRGVGRQAIDALCRLAFEQLALHRIYAYVLAINPGARRAFEKAGFVIEGTLRDDRWSGDGFSDTHLLARVGTR